MRVTRLDADGNELGEPVEVTGACGSEKSPELAMDDTGLPYRFEAAFCLPPAIAALLTGKPQLSLTVKSQNERTVLIEHTDYPNGISHTCIIPADGPAPRDVA